MASGFGKECKLNQLRLPATSQDWVESVRGKLSDNCIVYCDLTELKKKIGEELRNVEDVRISTDNQLTVNEVNQLVVALSDGLMCNLCQIEILQQDFVRIDLIGRLSECLSLQNVTLSEFQVTAEMFTALSGLNQIETLDIFGCGKICRKHSQIM